MLSIRHLTAPLLLALLGTNAQAQVLVQGRVLDAVTRQPIAGATVVLEGPSGSGLARRTTGAGGEFSFIARGSGTFRLVASRLGYRTGEIGDLIRRGGSAPEYTIALDPEPVAIPGVEVRAAPQRKVSPTLAGFHRRRLSSIGWFIDREEIENQKASRVSNILARAPGVRIERGIVYMARAVHCPAQIVIDGFHINRPVAGPPGRRGSSTTEMFPIDELVRPDAIEGIEVYQGLSSVPPEFRAGHPACGLVAIWTRRGD